MYISHTMNSGIYQIRNIINNKIYIGSAVNFDKRKISHFNSLKRKDHHSSKLQNSFNKYGLFNFVFEPLVKCPKEYLIKLEQWFIDNLNPNYNILPTAGSPLGTKKSEKEKRENGIRKIGNKNCVGRIISEETRLKISESNGKKVLQYDLDGNFVREWKSMSEAGRNLKVSFANIQSCCVGKIQSCKKFIWRYKTEDYLLKIDNSLFLLANKPRGSCIPKPIIQYDLDLNLIKIWDSIQEAANFYNVKSSTISASMLKGKPPKRNKHRIAIGYIWKHVEHKI